MGASAKGRSGLWQTAKRSVQEFTADDMSTFAAALSYQVFLSLFPFAIFLLALLGMLNIPGFFNWLLEQSQAVMPDQAHTLVKDIVSQVRGRASGGLLSFGAIIALWTASAAVRRTMNALNAAYDVEEERAVWKKFLLSILYTLVLAVLIIAAVGLMLVGGQAAQWIGQLAGLGSMFATLWTWLRIPVAAVLLMLALALVYHLFPKTDLPFRFITPGAVIAVIVWVAASLGFSFYVKNVANYGATYGALGAVIVLLLYFFISAAIMLFGAEINAEIYTRSPEETRLGGTRRSRASRN